MYREDTYQRVINRIHELRLQQKKALNFTQRIELGIRIDNLKSMIVFYSDKS